MTSLQKILPVLVLLLLLPITLAAAPLGKGDTLQPFSARDMDGKTIDLSTVIGKKPVMLVFWASWCPNCKTEVPKVNALVKKLQPQGMEFIGINVGYNDSEGRARRFMEKTGMAYPVIFDKKGTIPRQYGVQGVPTILVADRKGRIVFKDYGVPNITEEIFKQLNR
jgi:peroxiredoxin